jgi:large subunit ribosomal protein L21
MATETKKTTRKKVKTTKSVSVKDSADRFAVIQTGGKQYLVRKGDVLKVEKIKNVKEGDTITFDKILLVIDGGKVKIGTPFVKEAKVTAKCEGEVRGKKITILKYKPKTRYRVKKGHRQTYSKITITDIK